MNYYKAISEFCTYPKTDDITLDFFNFLEENYPLVWNNLTKFYADDSSQDTETQEINPRMGLYGWDSILDAEQFYIFLTSLKSIWNTLTEQDFGICECCKEEKKIEAEHDLIVSYDFGPVVKYYDHFEMDGSVFNETLICRQCAIRTYKNLVDKVNEDQVTCVV